MLAVQIPSLVTIVLVSIRIGTMLAFTPVFTMFPIPATARVLLVAMLSIAIGAALPIPPSAVPLSVGGFIQSAALEFSFGLLLACGIFCAFSAIAFAGRALDIQIGFGIGQVFDPISRTQVPIITSIFLYTGVLLFFLLDGHHAVLRGLAYTLAVVPVGEFSIRDVDLRAVIAAWGNAYGLGFMLIAPVAAVLLVVELGLGVLARGLPQMNVFVIALPIKIMIGLVALTLWARFMPSGLSRVFGLTSDVWNGAVR
ncbi:MULTISPECIES: flagellar biosynthetic protein FliR [Achromobacter]|uniref:flagellar biosynthetic protein FliR n=1 Tax=Achromobacter TaxID=222 RepID=UPI000EEBD045|nr:MULTISPECIES: flagellar biosynthetic protein FliR [Achromobacter]MDR6602124.1 flagellar biosynthetic protein FliR [Achromobacter deleyi]HCW20085.1 type III secretion protein [Achromobacter sp.]